MLFQLLGDGFRQPAAGGVLAGDQSCHGLTSRLAWQPRLHDRIGIGLPGAVSTAAPFESRTITLLATRRTACSRSIWSVGSKRCWRSYPSDSSAAGRPRNSRTTRPAAASCARLSSSSVVKVAAGEPGNG